MNKKWIIWTTLIITTALISVTSVRYLMLKSNYAELNKEIEITNTKLSIQSSVSSLLTRSIELAQIYNGQKVNNEMLQNYKGETISLYSLLQQSPLLILRFSEISCNVCVDSQVDMVGKFLSNTDQSKFAMIASYANPEHMSRYKRLNQIEYEIYNFEMSLTGFQETEFPFYFILDKDHAVKDAFIPIKELPSLTESYFNRILIKHFHKQP